MSESEGKTDPPEVFEPSSVAEEGGVDEDWKEEYRPRGDGLEPDRGSFMWWFGIDGKPSFHRRSPFRKLVVGVTLVVCIFWMLSQTVCASGPM